MEALNQLTSSDLLFHLFAFGATLCALLVVLWPSPVYSALFLAVVMSALGALFFMLDAYFIAVAQITVYAGAVMVLFVMVLMLFDLKHDDEQILKFSPTTVMKVLCGGLLCGFLVGTGWLASRSGVVTIAPNTSASDLAKSPLPEELRPAEGSEESAPALGATCSVESTEKGTCKEADSKMTAGVGSTSESQPSVVGPGGSSVLAFAPEEVGSTKELSAVLFSKFVFAFEVMSVLLLVAIVGVVALAKSKGGTHHAGN